MKALLPAILTSVRTRKDRSIALTFETREVSEKVISAMLAQAHNEGYLLFSPNDDITEKDIPEEKADALMGSKTPAQRLRSVLYVRWQQRGKNGKFDDYYKSAIEAIIDTVKETLEDE